MCIASFTNPIDPKVFKKKVFGGHMCPFLGATGTPVLDFWWRLLRVSKWEWGLPYFCGGECNVHSPRSTSSATHADLLVAGSAVGHFPSCISRGGTWLGFEWAITWTEDERATIVSSDPAALNPRLQVWSKIQDSIVLCFLFPVSSFKDTLGPGVPELLRVDLQ